MSAPRPAYGALILRLLRLTLSPAALRPWGVRRAVVLALFVPLFLLVQSAHWLGLLLDELLFPGYRRIRVREPVFVVGLPRSGTSYLQRVLARDEARFTTLRLWELLLAPSVTERRLWRALAGLDRRLGGAGRRLVRAAQRLAFRFMDQVHSVDLADPEEDYFLLLPAFACFLLVVPFPCHDAVWALARFDDLEPSERRRLVGFYRSCLQRHLYVVGPERTLLSKNPSFTPLIRSLLEAFPRARLIVSVRDPVESVPSLLSSLRDGARIFGWDVATPRYRDRLVDMLRDFVDRAAAALPDLPGDRWCVVPLGSLREDVGGTVADVYRRFGWSPTPAFRAALAEETVRAREHRSGHRYAPEEFGLAAEDLSRRFDPLLARMGASESRAP